MSYDYNALVSSIVSCRKQAREDASVENLEKCVNAFTELSNHCPMTPLLWIQYAHDSWLLTKQLDEDEALEIRCNTLQLGIHEFPGCALLRLHYLQLLMEAKDNNVEEHFRDALQNVGRGSHSNEGELVPAIYRLYAKYLVNKNQLDKVQKVFLQRASVPLKNNDGLMHEMQEFCTQHKMALSPTLMQQMEEAGMWVSKTFSSLATWEDEVDMAMHQEGILARHAMDLTDIDWDALIQRESSQLWMGLGGFQSAQAFIKYARACFRYVADDEEDQSLVRSLAAAVYERGIAECPTVESLWLSYITHLRETKSNNLENVASRAVMNCPYSLALHKEKLQVPFFQSEMGWAVLDPDVVLEICKASIDLKFLPKESQLELYMDAIRLVKRHIMSSISKATPPIGKQEPLEFDDPEPVGKNDKNVEYKAPNDETEHEVLDLVEDLKEMYDTVDTFLVKNHKEWKEGLCVVWNDRAATESILLGPLASEEDDHKSSTNQEASRCFAKLVRIQQPCHPNYFRDYIQCAMTTLPASTAGEVVARIRKIRGLYQKSMSSVKKYSAPQHEQQETGTRDASIALYTLCQDYVQFELCFGSNKSHVLAKKTVEKKLQLTPVVNGVTKPQGSQEENSLEPSGTTTTAKRKMDAESIDQPAAKKSRPDASQDEQAPKPANLKVPKKEPEHKVRVGKVDYPAHPFTVRVTNLSQDTRDMDLVDLFKENDCAPIVHARIMREKGFHGKKGSSKGWGLVQFEEKSSVEKALKVSNEIGLHERLVQVERSHVPAVSVVPPGMHRLNPKGEGKSSKQNEKRRNQFKGQKNQNAPAAAATTNKKRSEAKKTSNDSILAFRPRGVGHGHAHHKVHLTLSGSKKKGEEGEEKAT